MKPFRIWHNSAVILGIISLFVITYITILTNNFRTPEATTNFFKQSNSYYYIAEIIKANIRNRYSVSLRTNILELTVADTLLNNVVTQNIVERIALPVLKARARIAKLPLSFAENNLVFNTQQYTQQFSSTLDSLQLPPALMDAGKKLIASVPPQITIVDVEKNPNSILTSITRTRIFFTNVQKILSISWVIFIICIVTILVINIKLLKRLISGFLWIFTICGVVILLASFTIPAITSSVYSNPDPIAGILKDNLINGMVTYYFSLTRTVSVIYILIALALFLVYRFVPFTSVQSWTDRHLLQQPTPAIPQPSQRTKTPKKKK